MSRLREEQKAAMSRLREEQKAAMSRLREEQKAAISRLREEQKEQTKQIVVAGALIVDGAVLVAQRDRPAELAGQWELPGGKVGPGESEPAALARELAEELDIEVRVGSRLGQDVALSDTTTLRAYLVTQICGRVARANDHRALRWVAAAELDMLDWVRADRTWLPELTRALVHR